MQKEFIGKYELKNIRSHSKLSQADKVFLVTGKKSFNMSGAKGVIERELGDISYEVFNDFTENPKIDDIKKGMHMFRKSEYTGVIAIGGGSVIDMAKLINILSAQEGKAEDIIKGSVGILNKGKHFTAIPTTAGAGSEATHFAVAYDGDEKYSVASEFILPDTVILDPVLTFRLGADVTATSGMDALSQAIESYWNVNSNAQSKEYSSKAISLIISNLEKAVNDDEEARYNMSVAANLAGKAINITKTTAPHAVSYTMTSHFGVPHGQAVSITLGEFLKFNHEVTDEDVTGLKKASDVKKEIDEIIKLLGARSTDEAAGVIHTLMKRIGLKTKLGELGISSEEDLELIISKVNLQRLNNNPRKVTTDALKKILRNIS